MSAIGGKRTYLFALQMSAYDPKRTSLVAVHMSAIDPKRTSACRHLCRGTTVVIKKVLSKLVQSQQIGLTHYQFLSFILSLR